MDEAAIIRQAQKGDVAAYNRLVLQYQGLVYNVVYRIIGEPQGAEDMTQEAFISAYQALNRFRGGNFKAWLLRIATNACYDELRRHKRRPQSSLDELTEENDSFAFLRSPEEGPEAQQMRLEMMRAIEHCLDDLPDDQRVTAVLRDIEGYDYNEIADITSSSLGTVKSRLSRARNKLRDCLQGFMELLPAEYRLQTN
ncbi:MAG: sigma-70 family RNA polymerase sigma factor [Chloroflexi bacterium]|jgi:RNA polymerase sigma-70 factor (ECF subfamily)|nr:sigma-70 family RNA polymerase sigma factor [Chloroflexota bacterium]MBK6711641.1 sigma-70 family RNA polymerase sigma factor [Chloroflexota bacterium]MBK7177144.1 sigma-70 family RNA polymerase sigma factor [Chloroflexota bacterium]MBK7919266.1 sigma-70 family RNA polymerase sigma factor [Chloroflexota bacterium]MBP7590802.1 sigma-70 family RNA polymerase sigma factor [Chloroflexota bacterium]